MVYHVESYWFLNITLCQVDFTDRKKITDWDNPPDCKTCLSIVRQRWQIKSVLKEYLKSIKQSDSKLCQDIIKLRMLK